MAIGPPILNGQTVAIIPPQNPGFPLPIQSPGVPTYSETTRTQDNANLITNSHRVYGVLAAVLNVDNIIQCSGKAAVFHIDGPQTATETNLANGCLFAIYFNDCPDPIYFHSAQGYASSSITLTSDNPIVTANFTGTIGNIGMLKKSRMFISGFAFNKIRIVKLTGGSTVNLYVTAWENPVNVLWG